MLKTRRCTLIVLWLVLWLAACRPSQLTGQAIAEATSSPLTVTPSTSISPTRTLSPSTQTAPTQTTPSQAELLASCQASQNDYLVTSQTVLTAYEPIADTQPVVTSLLTNLTCWFDLGGDPMALATLLDEATEFNNLTVTVTPLDVSGDEHQDIVVHIPVMDLPLLVFMNEATGFSGYALPANYAETLHGHWWCDVIFHSPEQLSPLLVLTDLTGDGVADILLTYNFPGGSGFHLQPLALQWRDDAFQTIFAAHLINWAGQARLILEPDSTSAGSQQIVLSYPYLYADGFDHKQFHHPLGQQVWRWSQADGRFTQADASVDLEHSDSDPTKIAPLSYRLHWLTNEGEQAYRQGDYDTALLRYNQVLTLAGESAWQPGRQEVGWPTYAAFRRALTLMLRGQADASPPAGWPAEGLASLQAVAADESDPLGGLAVAFLSAYDDDTPLGLAQGIAAMQSVDIYRLFYDGVPGPLVFPINDPNGIVYPGAGLTAYLNAQPQPLTEADEIQRGLLANGFAVEKLDLNQAGILQVTLRTPSASSAKERLVDWVLAQEASVWRVINHSDIITTGFEPMLLDQSTAWPVVGSFRTEP